VPLTCACTRYNCNASNKTCSGSVLCAVNSSVPPLYRSIRTMTLCVVMVRETKRSAEHPSWVQKESDQKIETHITGEEEKLWTVAGGWLLQRIVRSLGLRGVDYRTATCTSHSTSRQGDVNWNVQQVQTSRSRKAEKSVDSDLRTRPGDHLADVNFT
jgi:hypothetical protein